MPSLYGEHVDFFSRNIKMGSVSAKNQCSAWRKKDEKENEQKCGWREDATRVTFIVFWRGRGREKCESSLWKIATLNLSFYVLQRKWMKEGERREKGPRPKGRENMNEKSWRGERMREIERGLLGSFQFKPTAWARNRNAEMPDCWPIRHAYQRQWSRCLITRTRLSACRDDPTRKPDLAGFQCVRKLKVPHQLSITLLLTLGFHWSID